MFIHEAMRKGISETLPIRGNLFNRDNDGNAGACALGAIMRGIGIWTEILVYGVFPALSAQVRHPVYGEMRRLSYCIVDLNDCHDWTREQIADWVESIEMGQARLADEASVPAHELIAA